MKMLKINKNKLIITGILLSLLTGCNSGQPRGNSSLMGASTHSTSDSSKQLKAGSSSGVDGFDEVVVDASNLDLDSLDGYLEFESMLKSFQQDTSTFEHAELLNRDGEVVLKVLAKNNALIVLKATRAEGKILLTSFNELFNNFLNKAGGQQQAIIEYLLRGSGGSSILFDREALASIGLSAEEREDYLEKLINIYLPSLGYSGDVDKTKILEDARFRVVDMIRLSLLNDANIPIGELKKELASMVGKKPSGLEENEYYAPVVSKFKSDVAELSAHRDGFHSLFGRKSKSEPKSLQALNKFIQDQFDETVKLVNQYEFGVSNISSFGEIDRHALQSLKEHKSVLYGIVDSIGLSYEHLLSHVDADDINKYKFIFTGNDGEAKSPYVSELMELIQGAESSIEFATLTPPNPDAVGLSIESKNTYTYLVEAFSTLATNATNKNKTIDIRIVYGRMPRFMDKKLEQPHIVEEEYLKRLVDDIKTKSGLGTLPFHIQFTGFARSGRALLSNPLSWNHAKVMVVDGINVNIGGTNLYEGYNSSTSPIKDVSTTFIDNPELGSQVHKYIYNLATASHKRSFDKTRGISANVTAEYKEGKIKLIDQGKTSPSSVKDFLNGEEKLTAIQDANMIVVPRYGYMNSPTLEIRNISDIAQVKLIDSAKKELFISQQGIYPMNKLPLINLTIGKSSFNGSVVKAIQNALNRNVEVTIVKSADQQKASDKGLYDGLKSKDMRKLLDPTGEHHNHLQIIVPQNDKKNVSNHAKVVIIDPSEVTASAYMGSHNLYDASHAEYGYIVQDKTFVNRLYNQYYNNLKNEEESRDLGQSQVRH